MGPAPGRVARFGATLLAVVLLGACARTMAPEGGETPWTPPRVISTSPDSFDIVEPFGGSIRFEFDRTLSERMRSGSLQDLVVVSPRIGDIEVRRRGSRIEVSMEGGFRTPTVYRVTVLPFLQDRYQNIMDRPFDLFFSTGPAFEETLVAGFISDRLTGTQAQGIRVDAVPSSGEGPVYTTVTDSTGVFAFRYIPPGAYDLVAWDDVNRNLEPDFPEPRADAWFSIAAADTIIVTELALLANDTTAAELQSARVIDSITVELTFDDYLDPDWNPGSVVAMLAPAEDEEVPELLPSVAEVLHTAVWQRRVAAERAIVDEGEPGDDDDPGDPDDPDIVLAIPDAAPRALEEDDDEDDLPARTLVLILRHPLPHDASLVVSVQGVENINALPDGGGEATFTTPPEPEPPPDDDDPTDDDDVDPPCEDPPCLGAYRTLPTVGVPASR